MYKFCVFAGTTEGRELVEFLAGQEDVAGTACVATDYGEALLPPAESSTVSARSTTAAGGAVRHSSWSERPSSVGGPPPATS